MQRPPPLIITHPLWASICLRRKSLHPDSHRRGASVQAAKSKRVFPQKDLTSSKTQEAAGLYHIYKPVQSLSGSEDGAVDR